VIKKEDHFKNIEEKFFSEEESTVTSKEDTDIVEMENGNIIVFKNGAFLVFESIDEYQNPSSSYTVHRSFKSLAMQMLRDEGAAFSRPAMFSTTSSYAFLTVEPEPEP
jgi:hypothetical protein